MEERELRNVLVELEISFYVQAKDFRDVIAKVTEVIDTAEKAGRLSRETVTIKG